MAPEHEIDVPIVTTHAAPTTEERRDLAHHVTRHDHGDRLFRTAESADEQQAASDVAEVRPVTRPSRDLFHQVDDSDAAARLRPTPERDESVMRSLRFPFDEGNCC